MGNFSTGLFGGRGRFFSGTLLGAVLFQTVEHGLVIINADSYHYRLILSSMIYLAVLIDTGRVDFVERLTRCKIRETDD